MINVNINTELLAAYVEGNVSSIERDIIRKYLAANPEMIPSVLYAMDDEKNAAIDFLSDERTYLRNLNGLLSDILIKSSVAEHKMNMAMAASNVYDNLCAIRCEGIAMRHFGNNISDEELLKEAKQEGWIQDEGMSFSDIGKLSQSHGYNVEQIENGSIEQLKKSIDLGHIIIAFVDAGELTGNYELEKLEDKYLGKYPNHVVIVKKIIKDKIVIIDSYTPEQYDTYPLYQFLDAWNDSGNNMVVIESS